MRVVHTLEASNKDLHKLERRLVYEVSDDKSNIELCQVSAKMVLTDMLNEAFHRGIEFQKRLQN